MDKNDVTSIRSVLGVAIEKANATASYFDAEFYADFLESMNSRFAKSVGHVSKNKARVVDPVKTSDVLMSLYRAWGDFESKDVSFAIQDVVNHARSVYGYNAGIRSAEIILRRAIEFDTTWCVENDGTVKRKG